MNIICTHPDDVQITSNKQDFSGVFSLRYWLHKGFVCLKFMLCSLRPWNLPVIGTLRVESSLHIPISRHCIATGNVPAGVLVPPGEEQVNCLCGVLS